nr:MAG TPA: hypothetical protein [Caudoviricetes sp.]
MSLFLRIPCKQLLWCATSYKKLEVIPLNNTIMFISCRKLVYIMLKTLY